MTSSTLPRLNHLLELCLYSTSLTASHHFYSHILQLPTLLQTPRMIGFEIGPTALLVFERGKTLDDIRLGHQEHHPSTTGAGGWKGPDLIPKHGLALSEAPPALRTHFAIAVDSPEDVDQWERHLVHNGVKLLGKVEKWPSRGGRSVYFEDPDANVGEIASRGIWNNY